MFSRLRGSKPSTNAANAPPPSPATAPAPPHPAAASAPAASSIAASPAAPVKDTVAAPGAKADAKSIVSDVPKVVLAEATLSAAPSKPKIFYWNVKARGQLPMMILSAGRVDYEWDKSPGDYKAFAPFGQLPVLKDGNATLGQSGAITRYCAKLAKLEGDGADWNTSQMMLEEHNDIFDAFVAAKYRHANPDSEEAWNKCIREDVPKHLAVLESKISASGFFGSKLCAGDIAICSNINFGLDNGLDMKTFPKLASLYKTVCGPQGACAEYMTNAPPPYFRRKVVLYYWKVKARAQLPMLLLTAGKIPYTWEESEEVKPFSPSGQLPVLKDGEKSIGHIPQSMAIIRYCAKASGLSGEDADWEISETMLEEHNDIFDAFVAAKYRHTNPDSEEAWNKCIREDVPKHLAVLESKISASGFFGSKLCAGDIAICSNINFGLDNGLDMKTFPKLANLYKTVCGPQGACAEYMKAPPPPYFKRPAARS